MPSMQWPASAAPVKPVAAAATRIPADPPEDPNYIGAAIPGRPGFFRSGPGDSAHLPVTTTFRPSPPAHDVCFEKVSADTWKQIEGGK